MPWFVALLLFFFSSVAFAETKLPPPVLLWGFQRGCTPLTNATRDVQEHLELTVTKPVDVLLPEKRLLSCQGPGCAAMVQRSCPIAKGRILGGIVDQNSARTLTRMRLWFFDQQTGQTAYHDNYCQNCDMTKALKANAMEIAQNPSFMPPPGSTPLYCQPEAAQAEQPLRNGKIYWVVYGKDHHKSAVTTAVRKFIQQLGPDVPVEHEGKEYTSAVLKKVLAKDPGAQVFGVEIQEKGNVEIFLYDGLTELIEIQKVECDGCDKDDLLEKVRQTSQLVLAHCFGENCARVGRSRAPAEACRPFEPPRCGEPGDAAVSLVPMNANTSSSEDSSAPTISPGMAKLAKGAVWSFFTASAVTTAALLAANYTSAGQRDGGNKVFSNLMLPGAAATGALTIVSLGIAIPTTLLVDRATAGQPSGATHSKRTADLALSNVVLQCPN